VIIFNIAADLLYIIVILQKTTGLSLAYQNESKYTYFNVKFKEKKLCGHDPEIRTGEGPLDLIRPTI